jgi:hypothetical protein
MRTSRSIIFVGTLVVMLSVVPAAVRSVAAQNRLAEITETTCTFSLVATGTWTDGEPEVDTDPSTLSFRFVGIDTDGSTADALGRFGPSHIITRLSGDYLHFMQMFNSGPLYVTTIIDRETSEGNLMAVHTRHEYTDVRLTGHTSRPEHYYGECEIGG